MSGISQSWTFFGARGGVRRKDGSCATSPSGAPAILL